MTEVVGIDVDGVTAWFEREVPSVRPPLEFTLIAGGRSNLTFEVRDAAGARWALRRPPTHGVLASAHDVAREHRVVTALAGTDVPVPPAVGLCDDHGVTGAPFFVMEFVDGVVLRDDVLAGGGFAGERRVRATEAMADTLAAIHAVSPDDVGLGDLGRREGYIERQLRRWHGQLEQARTRDLPKLDEGHRRLAAAIPEAAGTGIVHGDYRLDNLILSERGDVRAVLDWELCTLGDPLADVGLLVIYWHRPYAIAPADLTGFPTAQQLVDRYAERSGRDLSDLDFYVAFGAWKLAAILEGVYARYVSGAYGEGEHGVEGMPAAIDRLADMTLERLARRG